MWYGRWNNSKRLECNYNYCTGTSNNVNGNFKLTTDPYRKTSSKYPGPEQKKLSNNLPKEYGYSNTAWENYGGQYRNGSFFKLGNIVYLSGLIKSTVSPYNVPTIIGSLPENYRPHTQMKFGVSNHTSYTEISVHTSGSIVLTKSNNSYGSARQISVNSWTSLDGISFSTSENHTFLDRNITIKKENNIVYLSGTLSGEARPGLLFNVGNKYKPDSDIVLNTIGSDNQGRTIMIKENGDVIFESGQDNTVQLSFDSLQYCTYKPETK